MIDTELGTVIAVTPAEPRTVACVCTCYAPFDPDWWRVVAWATVVTRDGDLIAVPLGYPETCPEPHASPLDIDADTAFAFGIDRTEVQRHARQRWGWGADLRAHQEQQPEQAQPEQAQPEPAPFRFDHSTFDSPDHITT